MSDPLRIALVAEGPTDRVVVEAAITALIGDRPFILRLLQPEESLPFGPASSGGWGGIQRWGQGIKRRNGRLEGDILFSGYDVLILHLDADVADKKYADCGITGEADDLPCAVECPPARDTTDRLRAVLLRWMGETSVPSKTVLCTPSKSTETWVIAALFPDDTEMKKKGWECHPDPASRLGTKKKDERLTKSEAGYRGIQARLTEAWPRLRAELSEAGRFSDDFLTVVA